MVVLSAIEVLPLDLCGELADEIRVRARVDLAPEELRSGDDRDLRHFAAQALAGARRFELDLLVGRRHEALTFRAGGALGLVHQIVGAMLRLIDDLVRALARLTHDRIRPLASLRELLLALLRGGEPLRDLARALLHHAENERPHERHREPDEHDEHEHLHDEREIDVHGPISCLDLSNTRTRQCAACSALTKGFANVKNSAKPIPIIATASSRPATRNICMRSVGSSSGWRAEPSMKRPPRMPKPMAVPSAPMPKMIPTASTVMARMCASFSIQFSSKTRNARNFARASGRPSVMLVSHRQIDNRQHREYEGLDRDDKDMEPRPDEPENELADDSKPPADAGQRVQPVRQRENRYQPENH